MRFAAAITIYAGLSLIFGATSYGQQAPGRKEFPPGLLRRAQDLPESRFRTRLERLPQKARERAVAWLGNAHITTEDLAFLHADSEGGIFYADPAPNELPEGALVQAFSSEPQTAEAPVPINPFPASLVFHSKPGAPNVLYLNFVGETVKNTVWNTSLGRTTIRALPFSTDSDTSTFSDSERAAIKRIWQRVAEDYAPFNIDVTTERPATFGNRTAHALITRSTDAGGDPNPSSDAGGVAYLNVFGTSSYNRYRPAWIYSDNLSGNEGYIAEATSHEIGHNMGLSHDGIDDGSDYYGGHGSGETSWGPLMGTGYNRNVSQWSKGEYYQASNTQDDLTTIAGKISYRTDDHGNAISAATALEVSSSGTIVATNPENDPTNADDVNKGIIERSNDADAFSFTTASGAVNITVTPWIVASASTRGGNLDVVVQLYDSAGQMLAVNNPATSTGASIETTLAAGTYYLIVRSTGTGTPTASSPSGYTTYGSIGQYFINGTVAPPAAPIPPVAELAVSDLTSAGPTEHLFTVMYTDDVAINVATVGNDDIQVTGPNGYNRTATFVSLDKSSNGSPRVATYRITPPAGVWSASDNGPYLISVRANSIGDTDGLYVPEASLGSFEVSIPASQQALIVDRTSMEIPEGAEGTFTIRLAERPLADVTVTCVPVSGDADVAVIGGGTHVFTSGNWNVPVDVRVKCNADADQLAGNATIECRAEGLSLITVVVTEVEPPVQPLITGISNVGSVANISVAGVADIPHVLQVSSDLAMWNSIATNTPSSATVTFEDSNAGGLRFYRVILQ